MLIMPRRKRPVQRLRLLAAAIYACSSFPAADSSGLLLLADAACCIQSLHQGLLLRAARFREWFADALIDGENYVEVPEPLCIGFADRVWASVASSPDFAH